jgi:4'-phosphopantetheinyl transferase
LTVSAPWPSVGSVELEHGPRVWLVALDRMPASTTLLDASERARLGRLRSPQQARRYAARRSALRLVLGAALGLRPEAVPLESGAHGKPRLSAAAELSFNLSHRGETAVIALARAGAVGVDVESARTRSSPLRLAARHFHPDEAAAIAALPAELATDAFLRCWTAKEAVLKALGTGLSESMRGVVVEPDPRGPLRLLKMPGAQKPANWTLHALCLPRGQLTVALALPVPEARIAGVHSLPFE